MGANSLKEDAPVPLVSFPSYRTTCTKTTDVEWLFQHLWLLSWPVTSGFYCLLMHCEHTIFVMPPEGLAFWKLLFEIFASKHLHLLWTQYGCALYRVLISSVIISLYHCIFSQLWWTEDFTVHSLILTSFRSRPDTINTRPRRRPSVQLETDRPGIEASDDHDFLDMDDLGMDTEKARRLLGNLMHMQYTSQTYILI